VKLFTLTATVILVFAHALPAHAQMPEPPDQAALVRDAFASDYGQAVAAEFGRVLRAGADPACASTKPIAADQFEARGRALMTAWGARMLETREALIDRKAAAEKFAAGNGPDAAAEFARLKQNADVKRYLAIAQPMRQAAMLDSIFEQFDRYVLLARIKIGPVSPLASGNDDLLRRNPSEAIEDRLEKFTASAKSATLKRFLALSEKDIAASAAAIRMERSAQPVASIFFRGVETDLAELCILHR
jgi:hypothetical protein